MNIRSVSKTSPKEDRVAVPAHMNASGSHWTIAGYFARPKVVAWTGIVSLVAAGWAYLGLMVFDMAPTLDMAEAGPGMAVFNIFGERYAPGGFGMDLVRSICRVDAGFGVFDSGGVDPAKVGYVFIMWVAMTLAMMLPSAAPMIATYAEIAETAREKRIAVVSPMVLIAGYLSVWMAFCLFATIVQAGFARMSLLSPGLVVSSPYLGAGVLAVAGIYQFTSVKAACLAKCRRPFAFFFSNWSDRTAGVFHLGVRQGVTCAGCCWALMLVMFAAGLMNVIWISVLAILMVMEKVSPRPEIVMCGSGILFLVWASGLLALQSWFGR